MNGDLPRHYNPKQRKDYDVFKGSEGMLYEQCGCLHLSDSRSAPLERLFLLQKGIGYWPQSP